jgi:hypothetical protein
MGIYLVDIPQLTETGENNGSEKTLVLVLMKMSVAALPYSVVCSLRNLPQKKNEILPSENLDLLLKPPSLG